MPCDLTGGSISADGQEGLRCHHPHGCAGSSRRLSACTLWPPRLECFSPVPLLRTSLPYLSLSLFLILSSGLPRPTKFPENLPVNFDSTSRDPWPPYAETLHVCPESTIELVNHAIGATSCIFAEKCIAQRVGSTTKAWIVFLSAAASCRVPRCPHKGEQDPHRLGPR